MDGFYPIAYNDGVYREYGLLECLILVGCVLALSGLLLPFFWHKKRY